MINSAAQSSTNFSGIEKSIVEKIRKLLALADSAKNSHEHERDVAMQAALDLLAKHNLSMAHVEDAALNIEVEEVLVDIRFEPWVRDVLSAACRLYYTELFVQGFRQWNGRLENRPVFVGTAENIAVTIDMASWLMNSIRLESNRLFKEAYERRSFRLGAAERILRRATELTTAEKQNAEKTTGTNLLVVRNQFEEANRKHMSTKNFRPFKQRAVYLDTDAFSEGESFGDQVGLDRRTNTNMKRLPKFD